MSKDKYIFINENNTNDNITGLFDEVNDYIYDNIRLMQLLKIVGVIKTVIVEYDYVDKYYRDMYYMYYSGKFMDYPRDCIRRVLRKWL